MDQCTFVIRYAQNNPSVEIGVFVGTIREQQIVYRCISERASTLPVSMYSYGDDQHGNSVELELGLPGIKVLSDPSAKGIEFDTVFILNADRRSIGTDEDSMRMFVLCSRPRSELYFLGSTPAIPRQLAPAIDLIELRKYAPGSA